MKLCLFIYDDLSLWEPTRDQIFRMVHCWSKLGAKTETSEALKVLLRSVLELKKYTNSCGMVNEYPAMH